MYSTYRFTQHVLAHRYAAAAQLCRSFHLQSTLTSHGLVESETLGSLRGVSCFNSISAKLKTTEGPDAITSAKYEASEPAEITSVVLQSIVHLLDTLVHVLHIPLPHGMHPYYTPGISAISPSHSRYARNQFPVACANIICIVKMLIPMVSERLLLSPGIPSSTTTGDSDKTFSRTPAPWLVKESSDSLLSHSSHEALPCVHSSAHYARALSLLQANILVACLKMGYAFILLCVPSLSLCNCIVFCFSIKPSACKPPEAILHNMRSLHFCCEYRAKKTQQDLLVSCDRNNMNACATEPIARCTAIQPLCPSERYPCPERVLQYSDMLESSTHPHTSQPSPQDAPSGPLFDSSATTGEDDWAVVTLTSKM